MIVGDLPLCSPHYFLSSSVAKLLQSCLNLMKDSVVETSYNRSSRLHMYKRTHTYVVETSYNRSSRLHMYERTRTYVVETSYNHDVVEASDSNVTDDVEHFT